MAAIVVLGGGRSAERDVSLSSAENILNGLGRLNTAAEFYDTINGYEFLNSLSSNCIVLPFLHGEGGEDGEVQFELESRGLNFLGSGSLASKKCFNKTTTREILSENNIKIADGLSIKRDEYESQRLSKGPHILKVARGGSSIGTLFVKEPSKSINTEIDKIFELDSEVIIEELVVGVEITIPVLGERALPVVEIVPPEGSVFDYENKYNGRTHELCPPVNIDKHTQIKAQNLALKVHEIMGCRHFSRTDMIVKPAGEIVVLEINTIPGMTKQSLFPLSAKKYGLSFEDLVSEFIDLVKTP